MISFRLSEEQNIAQKTAMELARRTLRPLARSVDDEGLIPADALDRLWGVGLVQSLADSGSSGDTAGSAILSALLLEEIGWADAAFGVAIAAPLGFVRAIVEQGTAAQKAALLPQFLGDEYCAAAIAVSEPGFLGGVGATRATAVLAPEGYRLNGVKAHVPMALNCRHFLVIARSGGVLDGFIVAADAPGVKVEKTSGNLGLAALNLATVRFDNVLVPVDLRLGGNQGCDVQRLMDCGRVGAASILVGVARGVYEHSVEYTKSRVAHGTALARKQSVAFRMVDMFAEVEAARWLCWRAATHLDKRHPSATRDATLAHIYTAEQAGWITDEGVQLMGGHGFMQANPVELWYRNAKSLALLEAAASV